MDYKDKYKEPKCTRLFFGTKLYLHDALSQHCHHRPHLQISLSATRGVDSASNSSANDRTCRIRCLLSGSEIVLQIATNRSPLTSTELSNNGVCRGSNIISCSCSLFPLMVLLLGRNEYGDRRTISAKACPHKRLSLDQYIDPKPSGQSHDVSRCSQDSD